MDFNLQLPTDPLERRRLQNRVAQRKFRRKSSSNNPLLLTKELNVMAL